MGIIRERERERERERRKEIMRFRRGEDGRTDGRRAGREGRRGRVRREDTDCLVCSHEGTILRRMGQAGPKRRFDGLSVTASDLKCGRGQKVERVSFLAHVGLTFSTSQLNVGRRMDGWRERALKAIAIAKLTVQ